MRLERLEIRGMRLAGPQPRALDLRPGSNVALLLGDNAGGTDSNYEVADVVSTLANDWGSNPTYGKEFKSIGKAAEMLNNLIGMILVLGANAIAKKASDVSLY